MDDGYDNDGKRIAKFTGERGIMEELEGREGGGYM